MTHTTSTRSAALAITNASIVVARASDEHARVERHALRGHAAFFFSVFFGARFRAARQPASSCASIFARSSSVGSAPPYHAHARSNAARRAACSVISVLDAGTLLPCFRPVRALMSRLSWQRP